MPRNHGNVNPDPGYGVTMVTSLQSCCLGVTMNDDKLSLGISAGLTPHKTWMKSVGRRPGHNLFPSRSRRSGDKDTGGRVL
ncbi:unnamed protein product [Arctogadus glacialis]